MPRIHTAALLLPLLAACAPATRAAPAPAPLPLAAALDSVFADTAFAGAHWGVLVVDPADGDTLYARQPGKLVLPASNMKLVTGAAALEALGPEHRWETALEATGPVVDGTLRGDLVVRGSGDPAISERFGGDARRVPREWADSLRARGIERIEGRVVGDDDALDDVPLGAGWAWDDLEAYYAAEIGALSFNEGTVTVFVRPGAAPGDTARVALDPPTAYVPVEVRATTAPAGTGTSVRVDRAPTGPGIVVSGTVAADDTAGAREWIAVRNNTLFLATVLREALEEAGIEVAGGAVDVDDLAEDDPARGPRRALFVHRSPRLADVLPGFLKPSQNQIGELLLRTLGRELRGEGSARAGAAVVDSLLRARGLPAGHLRMADGSGLSRYNLLAPDLLVALLDEMLESPHRDVWLAALPVAGRSGTLERRMAGTPLEGRVVAKTGTLTGVRALSGYLLRDGEPPLLFSMIVDHHLRSAADADRVAEAALLRLLSAP